MPADTEVVYCVRCHAENFVVDCEKCGRAFATASIPDLPWCSFCQIQEQARVDGVLPSPELTNTAVQAAFRQRRCPACDTELLDPKRH